MPRVAEIIGVEKSKKHVVVHILTDEGDTATIWVGGEVDVFYHKGIVKAFVKRRPSIDLIKDKE